MQYLQMRETEQGSIRTCSKFICEL